MYGATNQKRHNFRNLSVTSAVVMPTVRKKQINFCKKKIVSLAELKVSYFHIFAYNIVNNIIEVSVARKVVTIREMNF